MSIKRPGRVAVLASALILCLLLIAAAALLISSSKRLERLTVTLSKTNAVLLAELKGRWYPSAAFIQLVDGTNRVRLYADGTTLDIRGYLRRVSYIFDSKTGSVTAELKVPEAIHWSVELKLEEKRQLRFFRWRLPFPSRTLIWRSEKIPGQSSRSAITPEGTPSH